MSHYAASSRQIGLRRYQGGGHPEISAPEAAQELGSYSRPAENPELLTLGRQTALLASHGENPNQEARTDPCIGTLIAKGASSPKRRGEI
jgi:hypothetical protein